MTRLLREQRDTAIQMAADAVALSAEHADRADGAEARTQELEARWQALKDWLDERITAYEEAREPYHESAGIYQKCDALISMGRAVLARMSELEAGE